MIIQILKIIVNFVFAFFRIILMLVWPGYSRAIKMDKKIHKLDLMVRSLVREQISLDSGERLLPDDTSALEEAHRKRYEFACTQIKDGAKVLDIACGSGYGSYMMSENPNISVTGVDISAQAVEYAKNRYKRKNLQFVCSDANSYQPSSGEKFDVIVSFETIEHLERDKQFIESVAKFLKPGGVFMVSTPNFLYYPEPFDFHYRHYAPWRMSYMLKKHGGSKVIAIYGQSRHKKFDLNKGFLHSYLGNYTVHMALKS